MKLKILSKRSWLIMGILVVGVVASMTVFFYLSHKESTPRVSGSFIVNPFVLPKQEQPTFGEPVRLKIPKIHVDAAVEHIGLASDGAMDVPKDPNNTGWYKPGSRPGEKGSAVIDGHLDWYYGQKAVFYDLHKLSVGDTLLVEDANGSSISFVVRSIHEYKATDATTDIFTSSDGIAHLNLITCQGAWDKSKESYTKRLVVFTDAVK